MSLVIAKVPFNAVTDATRGKEPEFVNVFLMWGTGSGPGCFSNTITNFRFMVSDHMHYASGREFEFTEWTRDKYFSFRSMAINAYSQYLLEHYDELIEKAALEWAKQAAYLTVLGDALKKNDNYVTAGIIESLEKQGIGKLYPGPAVINPSHPEAPRLCQSWFYVPPKLMDTHVPPVNQFGSLGQYYAQARKYFHKDGVAIPEKSHIPYYLNKLFGT